jgi:hypothetical protein
MNSKNDIPVHLPMYYLGLIPSKIANTMEVSHAVGSNHLQNISVGFVLGMVNMKNKLCHLVIDVM